MRNFFTSAALLIILQTNAQNQYLNIMSTNGEDHTIKAAALVADSNSILMVGSNETSHTGELLKLDQSGMIDWAFSFSPNWPYGAFSSVASSSSSIYGSGNETDSSVFILKLNLNGQSVWCKKLEFLNYVTVLDMVADSSGLYILSSVWDSTLTNPQAVLTKMDTLGNVNWSKKYQFTCYYGDLELSKSNHRIGMLLQSNSQQMVFIILDHFGSTINSTQYSFDCGQVLAIADSEYILIGYRANTTLIAKTNANGNLQWTTQLNDTNNFLLPGGGCYTDQQGNIYSTVIRYNSDPCLVKLSPNGFLLWAKSYGALLNNAFLRSAFPMLNGASISVGNHNVGFYSQYFILEDDTTASTSCIAHPVTLLDSALIENGTAVSLNILPYSPLATALSISLTPLSFTQQYACSNSIHEESSDNFLIYPNPTTDNFSIKGDFSSPTEIIIYSNMGAEILKFVVPSADIHSTSVSLDLPNGIYYCRISNSKFNGQQTFIISK